MSRSDASKSAGKPAQGALATLWDHLTTSLRFGQREPAPVVLAPVRPRLPVALPAAAPVLRPTAKPRPSAAMAVAEPAQNFAATPPPTGIESAFAPAPVRAIPQELLAAAQPVSRLPMQERYEAVTRLMLARYDIRVRKWRSGSSGVAVVLQARDGSIRRYVESPRPKGPMSVAIFLHEIGHHAIGLRVYKPRCLEEFHAWRWSLETMDSFGLPITEMVRYRVHRSLSYAIGKAGRRGIKSLPVELAPYLAPAVRPLKQGAKKGAAQPSQRASARTDLPGGEAR